MDTISSVKQFIGRNRLPNSFTKLILRNQKIITDSFSYSTLSNRYETYLSKCRSEAWNKTSMTGWQKCLEKLGKIEFNESIMVLTSPKEVETADLTKNEINFEDKKEFSSKKLLYQHYQVKFKKQLPDGYEVKEKWISESRKMDKERKNRKRIYYLTKIILDLK
jgi:hypothetical protein